MLPDVIPDQAEDRLRSGALSATGFACEPHDLSGTDREGYAVDRARTSPGYDVVDDQILDLEERARGRGSGSENATSDARHAHAAPRGQRSHRNLRRPAGWRSRGSLSSSIP